MIFQYKCADGNGNVHEGTITSVSKDVAVKTLVQKGLKPILIDELTQDAQRASIVIDNLQKAKQKVHSKSPELFPSSSFGQDTKTPWSIDWPMFLTWAVICGLIIWALI